ncbi:unnamed protein product [Symbiodinium sp. CCMP2592]|nr:unnamed protein product [Symbiodinium sp. CCMP2592]
MTTGFVEIFVGVVIWRGHHARLLDDSFVREDRDVGRDSECDRVGGSRVDVDEVAVGSGYRELGDEGAVDEVGDGDRFEGCAESCDGRCEQVVGHGAWEFHAFKAASDRGGFDDPDHDGEGSGMGEVGVGFAELDELLGFALVDQDSGGGDLRGLRRAMAVVGNADGAPGVSIAEDPTLVGHERVDVADEVRAGAVEVARAFVPDLGDELGVDDARDVGLPDLPDLLVEDTEVHKRVLVGEQVEVFTDCDGGFEVALPMVVEAEVGVESAERDQRCVTLRQVREDGAERSGYDRARGDELEQEGQWHRIGPSDWEDGDFWSDSIA